LLTSKQTKQQPPVIEVTISNVIHTNINNINGQTVNDIETMFWEFLLAK